MHLNVYFCTVALSRQLQGVCNPLAHEPLNRIWNHPASLITVIWKFTTFIKVYMILYRNYKIFTVGLLFSSMARSLNDDNFHRPVLKPCECTFIYLKRDFAWVVFVNLARSGSFIWEHVSQLDNYVCFAAMASTSMKSLPSWEGKFSTQ